MKHLLSVIAVALTFIAYVPYYRDILKGKTHPHLYSWSLWGVLTILIIALQIKGGAGVAIWPTISVAVLCLGVVFLSYKRSDRDITAMDTAVGVLSLLAMAVWLLANHAELSIVLAVAADLLAFIPTIRKSWNKPYGETLSLYATTTLRFLLVILAIENYTLLSTLWPATWLAGNALFTVFLLVRRTQVVKPKNMTK